jgi:hypothetical protein
MGSIPVAALLAQYKTRQTEVVKILPEVREATRGTKATGSLWRRNRHRIKEQHSRNRAVNPIKA